MFILSEVIWWKRLILDIVQKGGEGYSAGPSAPLSPHVTSWRYLPQSQRQKSPQLYTSLSHVLPHPTLPTTYFDLIINLFFHTYFWQVCS